MGIKKEIINGKTVFSITITDAANDDWIRAARLARKAKAGDEEAAKKLKEMEETKLVYYDDEGNEHEVE